MNLGVFALFANKPRWLLHPFPRRAWGWITQIAPPLPTPGSVGGCCCKKAWDLWFEHVWNTGDYNHWVDPQIPPPTKKKSRETIVLTIQIYRAKPHRFSLAPWDTIPGYPVSSLGQNAVHLVLGTRIRTNQDGGCHGMSPNNVWVQKIGEAYQSYLTQIYSDILRYTQHTWRVSQFSLLFRSLAKAIWL